MKKFLVTILLIGISFLAQAQSFSNGFQFLMPPTDSTTKAFLPIFEKQPITEFVSISPQGDFQINNQPTRFWGVNFTENANFPDQGDANTLVGRMRKMGINLVRFHHMDNYWTDEGGNIFNGINTLSFNPFTLQKFHYLLYKMKEEGIYANLNLLVTRHFSEADGIPGIDSMDSPQKCVSMFDGQMIQLQKDYASQLLTSTNIFTNLPLADDPVLAMIEINNENTIYGFWKEDALQAFHNGGDLLSRHVDTLDQKWNQFLSEKYGNHTALSAAWQTSGNDGIELLLNGDFEQGDIGQHWQLELHNGAAPTLSLDAVTPFEGNHSAKIDIPQNMGTSWYIQFKQTGFPLKKDTAYIMSFVAKASTTTEFWAGIGNDDDPYNSYGGLWTEVNTEWQEYEFYFTPDEDNLDHTRMGFSLGEFAGEVFFDNISITKFKKTGVTGDENLASANIKRILYSERAAYANQRVSDLAEFYIKLQTDYYTGMADFLRNTLDVKVPITGTNALGGLYEIKSAENLDYIDDHAYWNHPRYPDGWSTTNWIIPNKPMVGDDYLGTIIELFGGLAKANKPYTVSEYNHPSPNIYQAEMVPILASYGSFHGTDGLMFFQYNGGNPANWWSDQVDGFFNLRANPAVMSLFPVFAKAYRDFMIQEDNTPVLANYTEEYIYSLPQFDDHNRWWPYLPYDNSLALTKSIRTGDLNSSSVQLPSESPGDSPYQTSTGEIVFDHDLQLVHTQAAKIESLAGKLDNANQITSGKMHVSGEEHGVVSWISLSEKSLDKTQKSLLAISSRFQNTGMIWDGTTTIHDDWGNAPTEMMPLNLDIQLDIVADSIHLYPLDGKGDIMESITYLPQNGKFQFNIDQNQLQTLWFGIEAFHQIVSTNQPSSTEISLFPNPISTGQYLHLSGLEHKANYQIFNAQGQIVSQGTTLKGIEVHDWPSGIYQLILTTNEQRQVVRVLEVL